MPWAITGWKEHYEDRNTRRLVNLQWYPERSKLLTTGYCALMEHEDGAAIYGVFCVLKRIAAAMPRDLRNGVLIRDTGQALTVKILASYTRLPEALLTRAFEVLSSPEIGWMHNTDDAPAPAKPKPVEPPHEVGALEEIAARISERHLPTRTMSPQMVAQAMLRLTENLQDQPKKWAHIDEHHGWRCENDWADIEPRFVKSLKKWLDEDALEPIPKTKKTEPVREWSA